MNDFDGNYKNVNNVNSTGDANGEGNPNQNSYSNMSTRDYLNSIASQASNNQYYNGGSYNSGTPYNSGASYDSTGYSGYYENNANQNVYSESYENYDDDSDYTAELKNNKKIKPEKSKKTSGGFKVFLKRAAVLTASAAVFGGVAGLVFNVVADDKLKSGKTESAVFSELEQTTGEIAANDSDSEAGNVIPTATIDDDGKVNSQVLDVSDIAEGVMPSVVSITIKSITEIDQGFFGGTYQYESEGSGSGIIIGENDTELLIVTNNHVVSGAETVSVSFIDDEVYEAKVKGTDSDSDLAIIVVDLEDLSESTLSQIKIATLGNSDELKVGEQVVAIGNALGYGQSVTTGIVSAKDRVNDTNTTPLIQTDAAINPGNSGGALLNMQGEVIGINSSKYASTDVEGMGYAIPISQVESILDDLMNRETRDKVDEEDMGYLGISCSTISQEAAEAYGMPAGVLVAEVYDNTGAKKAGIKKNSIITKVAGQSVGSVDEMTEILEYYAVGESIEVTFEYLDDEEYVEKTVTVTLGERPSR